MKDVDDDPWLTRKQAAKYMQFQYGTLAVWHCTKRYNLKAGKVGRSVRYKKSELDRFLNQYHLGAEPNGG